MQKVEVPKAEAQWRIPLWFPGLPVQQQLLLRLYFAELLKFNASLNLISVSAALTSDEVHFADCLYASEIILRQVHGKKIYDIGSGNGLLGSFSP